VEEEAETWRWLVNPSYHNCVVARSPGPQRKDRRRKYRRRIEELHTEMMQGSSPDPSLKAAHDAFVCAAIRHVRMESARKLVQEDLAGVTATRASAPAATIQTQGPYDVTAETAKTLGRPRPPPSMDNFVVRTSRAPSLPVPRKRVRRVKKSQHKVDGPGANTAAASAGGPAQRRGQRDKKAKKRKDPEKPEKPQEP